MPALVAAALLAGGRTAHGDGGSVRIREVGGPWVVTAFSSPTPLRAGPVEIAVMVQDRGTGAPVSDVTVGVRMSARDPDAPPIQASATREGAASGLLHVARLALPAPGRWELGIEVEAGAAVARVSGEVWAEPPLAPWRTLGAYLAFPPLAVAVFALHQWLRRRRVRPAPVAAQEAPARTSSPTGSGAVTGSAPDTDRARSRDGLSPRRPGPG